MVDRRLIWVHHLDVVLCKLGDQQLGVAADVPLRRLDLACEIHAYGELRCMHMESPEEGGLARAVWFSSAGLITCQ